MDMLVYLFPLMMLADWSWSVQGEICLEDVCEFQLDIRWSRTMIYRTPDGHDAYNVVLHEHNLDIVANIYHLNDPLVGTTLSEDDVITADGYPRNIITINGQFPGPTLEVLEGAEVKVTVMNNLFAEATSIHFHGMRQLGTTAMDGVPYVNQCPIGAGQNYTHVFTASPAGTHWYHSHMASQRMDGLAGMFIVHQSNPSIANFPMLLMDWDHVDSLTVSLANPYDFQHAGTGEYETNTSADNGLIYGDIMVPQESGTEAEVGHADGEAGDTEEVGEDAMADGTTVDEQPVRPGDEETTNDDGEMSDDRPTSGASNVGVGQGPPEEGEETADEIPGENGEATDDRVNNGDASDGPGQGPPNAADGEEDPIQNDRELISNPYGVETEFLYITSKLINGRGRYDDRSFPLTRYHVNQGERVRFRMVHAGATPGFQVQIDGHVLYVVASDGCEIDPIRVDYIFVTPGERTDFEVVADQPVGRYSIRVAQGRIGANAPVSPVVGVLSYLSPEEEPLEDTDSPILSCNETYQCTAFNCGEGSYYVDAFTTCISVNQARSVVDYTEFYQPAQGEEVHEVFVNFGFQNGPNMNGIKHEDPSASIHSDGKVYVECDEGDCQDDDGCECTHFITLPPNALIQLILSNYDNEEPGSEFGHHTTHLHGHSFAVMSVAYSTYDPELGSITAPNHDVDCGESLCRHPRWRNDTPPALNMDRPVIKDTVVVPSLGYSVVRFRSDNPGIWKLHCHVESHVAAGMALLFVESTLEELWTTDSLPVCTYSYPLVVGQNYDESEEELVTDGNEGSSTFHLDFASLVGIALGCFLLGATVAALVLLLVHCVVIGRSKKYNFQFPTNNEPPGK